MDKITETKELARYIEKLRSLRNISQEDFVDGVVSLRQYRRYMQGTSSLQMKIIKQLAEKLSFKPEYILLEFESEKLKETQNINMLYNSVVNYDFETSSKLFMSVDAKFMLDDDDALLFEHAKNLFDYFNKRFTETHTISKTKELIGFDKVLKKKALSTSELLILISFFSFKEFKDHHLVAQKLTQYINQQLTVVSGHNVRTVVLVLQQLAKYFGMIDDYSKVIEFCNSAIDYSVKMKSMYSLDYLFYYQALANYKLNNVSIYEESLYRCFCALQTENIPAKTEKFVSMIEKSFKIDYLEFIKQYIDTKKLF